MRPVVTIRVANIFSVPSGGDHWSNWTLIERFSSTVLCFTIASHSPIHTLIGAAAMQGLVQTSGRNLGFGVIPSQSTLWSLDNLFYQLSHSCPKSWQDVRYLPNIRCEGTIYKLKPIHPFFMSTCSWAQDHSSLLELLPAVTEWRQGDTLHKSPVIRTATETFIPVYYLTFSHFHAYFWTEYTTTHRKFSDPESNP